jgi:hypothetical protein
LTHVVDRVVEEEGHPDTNECSGEPPEILLCELLLRHFTGDLSEKVLCISVHACVLDGLYATHRDVSPARVIAMTKCVDLIRERGPVEVNHLWVSTEEVQIIFKIIRHIAHVYASITFDADINDSNTEDFFDAKSNLALKEEGSWLIRLLPIDGGLSAIVSCEAHARKGKVRVS